jgi:hypothetical protein
LILTFILCEVFRSGTKPSFGLRLKQTKYKTKIKFINQAENHRKEIVSKSAFIPKKMKPNIMKFPLEQLIREDIATEKYSHPAFVRKLPHDIDGLCDISILEKKLEFEMKSGNRYWFDFSDFFGKYIFSLEKLYIKYSNEVLEEMSIVGVEVFKVKRTNYLKLIFQKDLPF